jgi:hypothetical protein
MKRFCAAAIAAIVLAGCNTLPDQATDHGSVVKTTVKQDGAREVIENKSDYAAYASAKLELAGKPLFKLTCPPSGCVLASLEVSAPGTGGELAAPAPPPKVEHPFVGAVRETKELLLGLQPLAIAATSGHFVARVFDSFGRSSESIASRIQAPAPSIVVNGNNSAAAAGGTASSTGANSGPQSGNSGRVNSNDANTTNSGRINSNDANTTGSNNPVTNPPPATP